MTWLAAAMVVSGTDAFATDRSASLGWSQGDIVRAESGSGPLTLVADPNAATLAQPRLRELGFSDELLNSTLWMVPASGNPIERWGPFSNWLSLVLANVEARRYRQPVKRIEPFFLQDGDDQGVGVVFLAQTVVILFRVDDGDAVPAWIGSPDKLDPVRTHGEHYSVARVMRLLANPQ